VDGWFFLGLRHDHHFRNGLQEGEKLRSTQIVKKKKKKQGLKEFEIVCVLPIAS